MLIHLGAAQPVHSSCSTPTDPLLLPFPAQDSAPPLQKHNQHFHPSQGQQEPCTLSPQAAGRHSPASAFPLFALEPRLIFANPCPENVFLAAHLRAWHFPCPDDLLSAGSPPKAQLGTPPFTHSVQFSSLLCKCYGQHLDLTHQSSQHFIPPSCTSGMSQLCRRVFNQVTGAMSSAGAAWQRKECFPW